VIKLLYIFFSFFLVIAGHSHDLNHEIDLKGQWLFEIGDDLAFADPDYNVSDWVKINVPSPWENEGFPGYDGYGWYRIKVKIPDKLYRKIMYLKLGRIDDVDRTYVNGNLIGGKGEFPPKYRTAYDEKRVYEIPSGFLNFGKDNVITVRVFDYGGEGGLVQGEIALYSRKEVLDLNIDLSGKWRFHTGDDERWGRAHFDDRKWKMIGVPAEWEEQGFPRHDGYAWYRKTFRINNKLARKKLILVLGKINDVDQVFFNDAKIGETGNFPKDSDSDDNIRGRKNTERAYFIPPYLIKTNGLNTIAVRVYDMGKTGGIYSGYVGIVTRMEFLRYTKQK